MNPQRVIGLGIVCLAMGFAGCSRSGPQIVPVSGVLTRGGKPVPNLEVYFMPAQGRNSVGMADEQGKFKLGYTVDQDGALVGQHTVFVVFNPPMSGAERPATPADLKPIIAKYGSREKSPLKVEITQAVDNLELKLD